MSRRLFARLGRRGSRTRVHRLRLHRPGRAFHSYGVESALARCDTGSMITTWLKENTHVARLITAVAWPAAFAGAMIALVIALR